MQWFFHLQKEKEKKKENFPLDFKDNISIPKCKTSPTHLWSSEAILGVGAPTDFQHYYYF